ncbi:MAG: hypothetical protein AAF402_03500 [Pseudomonadota bacterium]
MATHTLTTRMLSSHLLALSLLALFVSVPVTAEAKNESRGEIYRQGMEAPKNVTLDAIPVCYDFGCKNGSVVNLPLTEWQTVAGWFSPSAKTPAEERNQLQRAVGWMEVLIGRYTPTHNDLAFDLPKDDESKAVFPGQMDCIDEAVNTTVYLQLFESMGLMRHHTVIEQAYRKAIFDQHWAGQIAELASGEKYVVDSWFQPNGHLPVIQKSVHWKDINILTAVVDNSPDGDTEVKRSWWHRFLRNE